MKIHDKLVDIRTHVFEIEQSSRVLTYSRNSTSPLRESKLWEEGLDEMQAHVDGITDAIDDIRILAKLGDE